MTYTSTPRVTQRAIMANHEWIDENGFLSKIPYPYLDGLNLTDRPESVAVCITERRQVHNAGATQIVESFTLAKVTDSLIVQELSGQKRATITPSRIEVQDLRTSEVVQTYRSFMNGEGRLIWTKVRQQLVADYNAPDDCIPTTVEGLFSQMETFLKRRWMSLIMPTDQRRRHPWRRIAVSQLKGPYLSIREAVWLGAPGKDGVTFGHEPPKPGEIDLYHAIRDLWNASPSVDGQGVFDVEAEIARIDAARLTVAHAMSNRRHYEEHEHTSRVKRILFDDL